MRDVEGTAGTGATSAVLEGISGIGVGSSDASTIGRFSIDTSPVNKVIYVTAYGHAKMYTVMINSTIVIRIAQWTNLLVNNR